MKQGEYFNLNETSLIEEFIKTHEYIYRYLPMEFLLDTLENEKLVFLNPIKWNDPFDNYLFKISEKNGYDKSFTKNLFCQCITLNPHSQAYWKTYGGSGFAARLQIRTREYFNSIKESKTSTWLGKMNYLKESQLTEKLKSINNLKQDLSQEFITDSFLKAFFLKRRPFEYENEIRVLIKSNSTKNNLKKIGVDTKKIIKEIRLDPRMGKNEEKAWKEYLNNKFKIKVTKSLLFVEKKIL